MNQVIGNLRYDTDKAKQLASVFIPGGYDGPGGSSYDDDKRTEYLYVTERGRYFVFVEQFNRNRIYPFTKEEARLWALENALDFDRLIEDPVPPEEIEDA